MSDKSPRTSRQAERAARATAGRLPRASRKSARKSVSVSVSVLVPWNLSLKQQCSVFMSSIFQHGRVTNTRVIPYRSFLILCFFSVAAFACVYVCIQLYCSRCHNGAIKHDDNDDKFTLASSRAFSSCISSVVQAGRSVRCIGVCVSLYSCERNDLSRIYLAFGKMLSVRPLSGADAIKRTLRSLLPPSLLATCNHFGRKLIPRAELLADVIFHWSDQCF